ncbi:MAG: S9 family peptidase [Bacteroidales bacterium]|nr:S9 family peptidase [Bacteroidales bacterium]
MKNIFSFILVVILCVNSYTQKKDFTLEDVTYNIYRQFYVQLLYNIKWRNNDEVTYVQNNLLNSYNIKKGKKLVLLSLTELNNLTQINFNDFPNFEWETDEIIWLYNEKFVICFDITKKRQLERIVLPDGAENISLCIKAKSIAFTKGDNLFIANTKNEIVNISSDTTKGMVYGKSVHRNEFGINKGIFWSNSGKYLAFYKMNESMVTEYPLVNIKTRVAEYKPIRYPMAGMTSHQVKVGIYKLDSKDTIYLKTGVPLDKYLTNICWTPDDRYILIAELNRQQNHMKLNLYDVLTGNFIRTLFEEKNEKYVEPLNPAYFINDKQFIWQSQRDGYNHLYLYDISGNLISQLTKGPFVVTKIIGHYKDNIIFEAAKPTPLDRNIFVVNSNNTRIKNLTNIKGELETFPSPDYKYFLIRISAPSVFAKYELYDSEGKFMTKIFETTDILNDYNIPQIKVDSMFSADNKTYLYYRLILPPNFKIENKYPLVLYVYGGPHAQLVTNEWLHGASLFDLFLAQNGYIVATIDNRGSANRGFEFESVTFRKLGVEETKDQIKFVEFLKKEKYIDSTRIAVYGWSYGGYMTLNLITSYPTVFRVGIAGGPVIDWKYYEVMYGERYMDTPEENPEGYKKTSLLASAKNILGKLLIIHGFMDDIVVLQHSLLFIEECIKNNVNVDFFIYPTQAHNIKGKDRLHLHKKIFQYLQENL